MSSRGALVIGVTSPIGKAIALALIGEGCQVVGVALHAFEDPVLALALSGDCSDPSQAERIVADAVNTLGTLDVVVMAQAQMPVAPAEKTSDAYWHTAIGATLDAAFFVARAAHANLTPGSSIVAVSSSNARVTAPGIPGYSAAKAGLEGLVRQLAMEWGRSGIRVNAVAPGMIGPSDLPYVTEGYPLGRIGTAEDVANAVAFLASDRASFITGSTLPVDGGLTIGSPAAWLRPDLRRRWE